MRFSQRIGKKSIRESLQIERIDKSLENKMWNTILDDFLKKLKDYGYSYSGQEAELDQVLRVIWLEFFKERSDEIDSLDKEKIYSGGVINYIKEWFFFKSNWYEKYDLLEFLARLDKDFDNTNFVEDCNHALKSEMSGYRIVDVNIVQITAEEEIIEIEQAVQVSTKFKPVNTHLSSALSLLSNREKPDFRNSIKESISAIESLAVIITGDEKASLGKALSVIESKYKLHGALKSAFSSLYGYTSDSGGIRHSLLDDDIEVTFEDAKFMLVVCSAFVNYLKIKTQ